RQLRPVFVAPMLKNGRRGTGLVFGRTATVPFSTSSIDRRSRKAWTDAGLPLQQLHSGRHTLVSYMAAADVPIADAQAVAGHADRRTTEDIYTPTIPGATAAVGETLSQFLDEQTAKEA
ncbi:MAG TPA: tyrosine-type recombinase/integrase, partial [Baekduia sp.]|nr:tyrosine-type recombinase/integrase [Baekduia sp.]